MSRNNSGRWERSMVERRKEVRVHAEVLTTKCDESCAIVSGALGQPSHDDHNVEMPAAQQRVYIRGWLYTCLG